VLEFAQLWKPTWLQELRGTLIGAGLLGNTFSWWDLPAYPIACAIAAGVVLWCWPDSAAK
jgi:hypothetical protein